MRLKQNGAGSKTIMETEIERTIPSPASSSKNSCSPQIVPDIEPKTVDDKTIIVVTVPPSPNRPYFLKSKGKEKGTYIRLAGTSRPAWPDRIKDLEMEGMRVSWDELVCLGFPVTEKATKKLCQDILKYRREAGLPKKSITKTQLINWKVLKEDDGAKLATNAFALLTSDHFQFSKTQCAVFKGTSRGVFVDKREYSGPIYEQIEEAVAFVLRNIRLGATIGKLVRHEAYELPVDAIREMIINAHCHRNMLDESCVQVAIYDDRLEVTSPGGLYNGLTFEQMMNGRSKLRNRAIANVFNQMGLIEKWGSGIRRIQEAAAAYGIREPEFIEMDDTIRVNLYRKTSESIGKTSERHRKASESIGKETKNPERELNKTQSGILNCIRADPEITIAKMSNELGVSTRNIESNLRKLREAGIIDRSGTRQKGSWEIIE